MQRRCLSNALKFPAAVLWLSLLHVACPQTRVAVQTEKDVSACSGLKIAVLDLNDLSAIGNYPKCSLEDVTVDKTNGIVYTEKSNNTSPGPHLYGTHSAPWYLYEAIKSSQYFTSDVENADIVYVYDYCFFLRWLGHIHSWGHTVNDFSKTPGDDMLAAYRTMIGIPAWQKRGGANFALYDSHPGYINGRAAYAMRTLKCSLVNSTHVVVDTAMRNVCPEFWSISKLLITPYVPNPLDDKDPESYLRLPYVPLAERNTMAYNRAKCKPFLPPSTNAGKLMRYFFSLKVWGNSSDMNVRCTDKVQPLDDIDPITGRQSYASMFERMRHTVFCPAFPGDSPSTRRLSEIFLAGCIPVFLGPPWHSMPFSETVPYKELGVFLNISDTSPWMKEAPPQWRLHPIKRPDDGTDAQWWVPDIDISDVTIQVQSAWEVEAALRAIPQDVLAHKLQLLHKHGTRFAFLQKLTKPANAVNSLLAGLCLKQKPQSPPLATVMPRFAIAH